MYTVSIDFILTCSAIYIVSLSLISFNIQNIYAIILAVIAIGLLLIYIIIDLIIDICKIGNIIYVGRN